MRVGVIDPKLKLSVQAIPARAWEMFFLLPLLVVATYTIMTSDRLVPKYGRIHRDSPGSLPPPPGERH